MILLSSGIFLLAVNTTILNPALPAIGADLHAQEAAFGWILGAYFAGFGAFQLMGGRLADFQARSQLLTGSLLVYASCALVCALAMQLPLLILARFFQGASGAIAWGIELSMIARLHEPGLRRSRALGICAFLSATGGSAGWLIGGLVSQTAGWRWIFLMSAPAAAGLAVIGIYVLRRAPEVIEAASFDWGGALAVTSALLLASFGFVSLSASGRNAPQTWLLFSACVLTLVLFSMAQRRARDPLLPRSMLGSSRVLMTAASAGLLGAAALLWSFVSAVYLQRTGHFTPAELGFIMMPTNVVIATVSLVVVPRIIARAQLHIPAVTGLALAGLGLVGLAVMPIKIIPGIILALQFIAIGVGLAYNPLLLRLIELAPRSAVGAASGIFNTVYLMTGAFAVSTFHTMVALAHRFDGAIHASAVAGAQYRVAFGVAAVCAAVGAVITWATRVSDDILTKVEPAATSERL